MVRRLGLGKNNHLTYASLVINPRDISICPDRGLSYHSLALNPRDNLFLALTLTNTQVCEKLPI